MRGAVVGGPVVSCAVVDSPNPILAPPSERLTAEPAKARPHRTKSCLIVTAEPASMLPTKAEYAPSSPYSYS